MPRTLTTLLALAATAGLGACASQRLDPPRTRAPRVAALDESVPAVPSGAVTASPLAPPPGVAAAPDSPPIPGTPLPPPPHAGPVANAAPTVIPEPVRPPPPPPPVAASGRSAVVGTWDAKDATGASCKVTLSSAPALDLYRANAQGCANKDLARVSAWDFRDGEVYLYQPGGTVAARLRQGGGALDGALTKSGASLALVR